LAFRHPAFVPNFLSFKKQKNVTLSLSKGLNGAESLLEEIPPHVGMTTQCHDVPKQ
jgi:hypothetical protein